MEILESIQGLEQRGKLLMEETLETDEQFSQAGLQGTEGREGSTDSDLRGWKPWTESSEQCGSA